MNLQEVQALTDDELRVKVAVLCGREQRPDGYWYPENSRVGMQGIYDYPNDLNACHEMEKLLLHRNDWSWCNYDQKLSKMTSSWKWNATARQRCEAFVLTLTQP